MHELPKKTRGRNWPEAVGADRVAVSAAASPTAPQGARRRTGAPGAAATATRRTRLRAAATVALRRGGGGREARSLGR